MMGVFLKLSEGVLYTDTHTPIAGDEVSHLLLQFKQHHAVPGVAVEGVDDKLVQVYAGGVGVLHTGL